MLKLFKNWLKSIGKNKIMRFEPGHFYSPIVDPASLKENEASIWDANQVSALANIDLNKEGQVNLLKSFSQYYSDLSFTDEKSEGNRFYYNNEYYSYTDAIVLYSMMRHLQPKNIIEIGSGFSSAVMLDVNDQFFDKKIELCFIEPHPERLNSLLSAKDKSNTKIINQEIQKVNLSLFSNLNAGDILFVDSSHVVKTGSDVHHILFEILPILKAGVLIHFHDIFYPFEYPKKWVYEGRSWNESYFLRAFLAHNSKYKIALFSDYLHKFHAEDFKSMPLCYKNTGGNIWLVKN